MPNQRQRDESTPNRAAKGQKALDRVLEALESPGLRELPAGTFVVINVETGEYVTAATLMDATTCFLERFPKTTGFAHRLGEPLFEPLDLDP